MADKKISDFTEITSVSDNDWLEVETSGGNSRKVKKSNLVATSWGFSPPTAASFSLASGDATNLTLTDDADVGLLIVPGAPVSGDIHRIAYRTLTDKTLDWTMVAKLDAVMPSMNYGMAGLVAYDSVSATKRIVTNGITGHSEGLNEVYNWGNLSTAVGSVYSQLMSPHSAKWVKMERSGSNLNHYISADGKNWVQIASTSVTAHLNAAPDKVGITIGTSRTTGIQTRLTIPYFSLTGAAV